MPVITFLQEFMSDCDASGIHEGAVIRLFKQCLADQAEEVVKMRVMQTSSANFYHEGALKSYCAIVQFLLKRYGTGAGIARLEAEVRSLRKESMTPTEYAHERRTRILTCGSLYDEKFCRTLFVGGRTHLIRNILRHLWAERQYASVEDLVQREEMLLIVQERWPRKKEPINDEPETQRGSPCNSNPEKR